MNKFHIFRNEREACWWQSALLTPLMPPGLARPSSLHSKRSSIGRTRFRFSSSAHLVPDFHAIRLLQ